MFDFGMETRRISDIVTVGANTRLSDINFLNKEVNDWLRSPERRRQIEAENYYNYRQAIEQKRRLVIGNDGKMVEDKMLPNNRIIDSQYSKMVDQKVNYILAKPLTFKSENETYVNILNKIFNNKFHRLFKNMGKDSYNGGIGYIYPYYDENGEFKFKRFKPSEIKVYWKDEDKTEIDCFIRYYEQKGYEGNLEKIYKYVEVYDTNGIHKFTYYNGALVKDYSTYHFETDEDDQTIQLNWNRVPLIPFKANSNGTSLLTKCKNLQDAINDILSEFRDGMQENASGNSIIVIKNYDGENLGTFRNNLSQYKAVKVRTVDGADGGIDKLEISVNTENYKTILHEMRKALIQNCRGYDVDELKSSGSPNEMTIKSIFSDIDLDANELETEYQASFEELLWFVNQHLANTNQGDFEDVDVRVIFNRDLMINESQVIADVNASSALLSKKTLLSMHPWIKDVEGELKQLEIEQNEQMELYGQMMVEKQPSQLDVDE